MSAVAFNDAVQRAVLRSKIVSTAEELRSLLYRSAYSTIMRESRDCNAAVLGPDGEVLVAGDDIHYSGCFRQFVHVILDRFPDLAEGDIFLTNHPHECGIPHSPDVAFAAPVYVDGMRIGFSLTIAHKPDIGGAAVGSAADARELIQEGLLFPAMRFSRHGQDDENVLAMAAANVRSPDLFLGDLQAQLGVTRVGVDRLQQVCGAMGGPQALLATMAGVLAESEQDLAARIGAWGSREVVVDGTLDSAGLGSADLVPMRLRLSCDAGHLVIDCTEFGDELASSINTVPAQVEMCLYYALIAVVDPTLQFSDGMRRVVEMRFRPGSILRPSTRAAVGASPVLRHRITDLMLEALGLLWPERAIAHSGGSGGVLAIDWSGGQTTGRGTVQYEVLGSAMGGGAAADGYSGVAVNDTVAVLTPIEVLESQFPLRISRFELIEDSGGAGEHRGGLSYRRVYEALAPAAVNRRADGGRIPSRGLLGGQPGRLGSLAIESDERVDRVPIAGRYALNTGDRLTVEGAGGGGYGDPRRRPVELVVADFRRGYISAEAMRDVYGVVVDAQGALDVEATAAGRGGLGPD
jgi:N-methylhydantoinase B